MKKFLLVLTASVFLLSCKKETHEPERPQDYIIYKVGDSTDPVIFCGNTDYLSPYHWNSGKLIAVTRFGPEYDYNPNSAINKIPIHISHDNEFWQKVDYNSGYAYIKAISNEAIRLQVLVNDKVIYDETKKNNQFSRDLTKDDFLP